MERPKRCYIRQEWFEAAAYLPPEDRCTLYEALFSFVYYGGEKGTLPPHIKGMYEMCKITLQKDIGTYEQKVMVNRQNGSSGGRPREGITQKTQTNPTKPKEPIHIHIHNTNNKEYLQSSISTDEFCREKDILVELFGRGVNEPLVETRRLCDYYDARGWVDKGGNPIVNAAALARIWKPQGESVYWSNVRQKWTDFLRTLPADMPAELCTDFLRLEMPKNNPGLCVIWHRNDVLPSLIENNYLKQLRATVKAWGGTAVEYRREQRKFM